MNDIRRYAAVRTGGNVWATDVGQSGQQVLPMFLQRPNVTLIGNIMQVVERKIPEKLANYFFAGGRPLGSGLVAMWCACRSSTSHALPFALIPGRMLARNI